MIPAICINDGYRPKEIPKEKWLVQGQEYTVILFFISFIFFSFVYSMQLVLANNKKYCPFLETISTSGRSTKKGFLFMRVKLHSKCIIEGCEGHGAIPKKGITEVFPRGYCQLHHTRFLKYGDPHFTKQRVGEDRCKHPLYATYKNIKQRCYNKNKPDYHNYGGRGIKVCDRWLGIDGFTNFCKDMGEKPTLGHSVDRINNNGNYEPSNCRWATIHQQSVNKRSNVETVGVTYIPKKDIWVAQMRFDGIKVLYKQFKDMNDAITERKLCEKKYL